MEQLTPYQQQMKDYDKLHCACPVCGSTEYETTTTGFLHIDTNRIHCKCGWTGAGHELVAKKPTIKEFIVEKYTTFFNEYLLQYVHKSICNEVYLKINDDSKVFFESVLNDVKTTYLIEDIKVTHDMIHFDHVVFHFEFVWKEVGAVKYTSHTNSVSLH